MPDERDKYVRSQNYGFKHQKIILDHKDSPITELIDAGILSKLSDKKYIPTYDVNQKYGATTLTTDRMCCIILPGDLTALSFSRLAESVIEIELAVMNYGIRFDDIHPWNFLLNQDNEFVMVDMGAFEQDSINSHWLGDQLWPQRKAFENIYINSLFEFLAKRKLFVAPGFRYYQEIGSRETLGNVIISVKPLLLFILYKSTVLLLKVAGKLIWNKLIIRKAYLYLCKNFIKLIQKDIIKYSYPIKENSYGRYWPMGEIKYDLVYSDYFIGSDVTLADDCILMCSQKSFNFVEVSNRIVHFDFSNPHPNIGPGLCWQRNVFERINSKSAMFIIDTDLWIGERSLTLTDLLRSVIQFEANLTSIVFLHSGKSPKLYDRIGTVLVSSENISQIIEEKFNQIEIKILPSIYNEHQDINQLVIELKNSV
jgi:hypothetical protein